jgi:L-lysine exporter family protein LysE/ArgO
MSIWLHWGFPPADRGNWPAECFIIRQGIGRSHILPIVLICIVADVILISCGVLGMGKIIGAIPGFVQTVAWLGAGFLLWLGFKSFRLRCTRVR